MEQKNKTQVIVVGAGPAGISAAITIAKAGKEVILIERGIFSGSKNMFGGAIYTQPTKEIFPDFENSAPLERNNIKHNYTILTEDDSTTITYRDNSFHSNSYTVIRSKFDRWMSEEAKKAGVILVTQTVVRELIIENKRIIGVKTELEDYFADIVILADGVNSLLAKQAGLRKDYEPKDIALGIKEVIKIGKDKINERFNIQDDEGCITEFFGYPMLGQLGLGFMYTNKDTITVGLGITLSELIKNKTKPYELLEKLKSHKTISPLIDGGELIEYSAHLIPEGGYKKIPKIYDNGVMIAGDSASLVNNLHWEGTNLAMISGKLAGETAVYAIEKNDFSKKTLSLYKKKLDKSFIMKDLKSYKDLMPIMHKQSSSFLDYYLRKINKFFKMFIETDSISKRNKFHKFIYETLTERNPFELLKDGLHIIKLLWGILK
ncbi:FAD-dependent oxidoreductase [bacterium]|nr:FAD-dependent oxidoreductase [bacterium]